MIKEAIGVCLGASSVSFVKLGKNSDSSFKILDSLSVPHNGDPKSTFLENLRVFNSDKLPIAVTGRKFRKIVNLPTISEPEATELAFGTLIKDRENYSAIATLGGETFIIYTLDDEFRIADVISKNQCASGTGEFFLQQIKRMNLDLDEAGEIADSTTPFKVSGRCSVFCKSDCTHALNKGIPKSEVTSGLALMMAEKVEELLKKAHKGKVLLLGGVTQNKLVVNFLKSRIEGLTIPEEATYFEAYGAAIYALAKNLAPSETEENLFVQNVSSFAFHQPLNKFRDKVTFKQLERGKAMTGDECILGLDVGSTTTKAILLRMSDNALLASVYLYTYGNPVEASRKCYRELMNQVPAGIRIIGLGTTGSGRQIAGLHAMSSEIVNEIVAHANASVFFDPDVDTIFEIGGQDAKYTYIVNKVPADYAMNEACSAGTGSFIEESAYESLGIKVNEIEEIAFRAERPPNFSPYPRFSPRSFLILRNSR